MVRLVVAPPVAPIEEACVWMDAGVLTYRLCDRGFDCEHCPLHAALRCEMRPEGAEAHHAAGRLGAGADFPSDRLYSRGHAWVKALEGGWARVRVGIDGLASSLFGEVGGVRRASESGEFPRGRPLCAIEGEGGGVAIGAPVAGRVARWNDAVLADASRLVDDPYGAGWIAELTRVSERAPSGLLDAGQMARQSRFDGRRFRRQVAMALLAETGTAGRASLGTDAGADLRRVLGAERYMALVRELVR